MMMVPDSEFVWDTVVVPAVLWAPYLVTTAYLAGALMITLPGEESVCEEVVVVVNDSVASYWVVVI